MDALGPVSRPVALASAAMPAKSRAAAPSAAADGVARRGPHQPDIRLEIRRDHDIDRVVFEYRRRSDGELVQRFPASQVVRFYQMMDSMAAKPAKPGDPVDRLAGSGSDLPRADDRGGDGETTSARTGAVGQLVRAEG